MNKDIHTYIAGFMLCRREKAKTQMYALQMTDISNQALEKIAIDLITYLNVFMSGNQHILIIINHLTGWPEALPISDIKVDSIVHVFINNYMSVHMCPRYILSDNSTEFKNQLLDKILQQLGIESIFFVPYQPRVIASWKCSTSTESQYSRSYVRLTQTTGTNVFTRYSPFITLHHTLQREKHHFSLCTEDTPNFLCTNCWNLCNTFLKTHILDALTWKCIIWPQP